MMRWVLVAVVAVSMALTGCKGKDGDAKKEGDKAGAKGGDKASSKSAHDRLQGDWGMDVEAMIAADPKMAAQVKAKPEMRAMLVGMVGSMTIKITKDEMIMGGGPGGKSKTSKYTVKSQEGNKITVESQEEGKDKKESITFELSDGDKKITGVKEGDKEKLVLVRK